MIYLNNAATSYPKPPEVIEAVYQHIQEAPFHSSRAGFERQKDDVCYVARENLAKLFNIEEPLNIIFTSGSTEALNLAIYGLELENAHVVTTGIEHNSVIRPLKHLEKDGKIELTFVDCDETTYVEPANIEAAIKSNTKAIVVNHSSNVTGVVLDLKEISKIAHKHNCYFVVDASQSAGNVEINCKDWDIDLLAFTGHKSLYGLPGIGGLYIKPGIELKPLKVGGTGTKSEVLYQPEGFPIYYEAGTPNMPGIISLKAGTEYIFKKGMENIREYKAKLVKQMIVQLENFPGITIYNKTEKASFTNFCFNIDGFVPEEVGYMLESSFDMIVRTGLHCAPLLLEPLGVHPWGTVRASPSYFTTIAEAEQFIFAVKEISNIKNKV